MIKPLLTALCLSLFPLAALAQDQLPALYDVTGVVVGDVLNIRAADSASAAIIGSLPRNAVSVEVISLNASKTWALVNTNAGPGYVSMRYLARQTGEDWGAMTQPLQCSGTEPFWALDMDPAQGTATASDPDGLPRTARITAVWPSAIYRPTAAILFQGANIDGLATLKAAACSDGMSDLAYGIAVDMFLRDETGAASAAFSGCCSLAP